MRQRRHFFQADGTRCPLQAVGGAEHLGQHDVHAGLARTIFQRKQPVADRVQVLLCLGGKSLAQLLHECVLKCRHRSHLVTLGHAL